MSAATAIVRADLVGKLLARALDGAAMIGEAENSALKMVHIARRENVGLPDVLHVLAVRDPNIRRRPIACRVRMPHGRYAGVTLLRIGCEDLAYLEWVASEHSRETLRIAAGAVLEWLRLEGTR
jgi:hypothetical protein